MTELTEQEIQANKEEFLSLLRQNVHRDGIENLLDFLENKSDMFTAPASTRFHGNFKGGLCAHSLSTFRRLKKNLLGEKPPGSDLSNEELEKCCIIGLLHDACKLNMYVEKMKNFKNAETGKWEQVPAYFVEDMLPYGHGEKSVYIISSFIRLTREEAFSIRHHMGGWEEGQKQNAGKAFGLFPTAAMVHIADMQSTYLDGI